MNKEKQLKRTMKKLKQQRDEAVRHATEVGSDAMALAQTHVDMAAQAKKEAERGAELALMNVKELREELKSLDERLRQVTAERDGARQAWETWQEATAVTSKAAVEDKQKMEQKHTETVRALVQQGDDRWREMAKHIDTLNARIAELEAFKTEHTVKTLQRRLAKKSEELRQMTAERDRLKAEMFHLQAIGRTVRQPHFTEPHFTDERDRGGLVR